MKNIVLVWIGLVLSASSACAAAQFQCRLVQTNADGANAGKMSYDLTIIAKGSHALDISASNVKILRFSGGRLVHASSAFVKKLEAINAVIRRNGDGMVQDISLSLGKTVFHAPDFWRLEPLKRHEPGREAAAIVLSMLRNVVFDLPKHIAMGSHLTVRKRICNDNKQHYSSINYPIHYFSVGVVNKGNSIKFRATEYQQETNNNPYLRRNAYVMEEGSMVIEKNEQLVARRQTWNRWAFFTVLHSQKPPYYCWHTVFTMKPTRSK